jgi:hypothetical protein
MQDIEKLLLEDGNLREIFWYFHRPEAHSFGIITANRDKIITNSCDNSAGEEERLSKAPVGFSRRIPGSRDSSVAGLHHFLNKLL